MIRLLKIDPSGSVPTSLALDELAQDVCRSTAEMYARTGCEPPWIGYLAEFEGQLVGTCAFKSPPTNGTVEIAYFTFPGFEGRGLATRMAEQLISIAAAHRPAPVVTAQTLPEENASTAILKKLGFTRTAAIEHPQDGPVWQWTLAPAAS